MAIVRWEPLGRSAMPWQAFGNLRRRMDRLFDEFAQDDSDEVVQSRWLPVVDVSENEDAYLIHAEVPGMVKKDIKITLQENVLTVSGEKRIDREKKNHNYHLVERSHGLFSRSFTLPSKVESDKIKADFKDGVLNVTVPKAAEAKAREIEIKVD